MRLYALTTAGLMLSLGVTSCSDHGVKMSAEPAFENVGELTMPLQFLSSTPATSLGGEFSIHEDTSGVGDCSSLGAEVTSELTAPEQADLFFALPGGDCDATPAEDPIPYCVQLETGWTLYELTGADPNVPGDWTAIPAADVELLTDPPLLPFSVCEGDPVTPSPQFVFDWNGNVIALGYGTLQILLEVNDNDCSSVCTSAPSATVGDLRCADLNDGGPACHPQCASNSDCVTSVGSGSLCLPTPDPDLGLCTFP